MIRDLLRWMFSPYPPTPPPPPVQLTSEREKQRQEAWDREMQARMQRLQLEAERMALREIYDGSERRRRTGD